MKKDKMNSSGNRIRYIEKEKEIDPVFQQATQEAQCDLCDTVNRFYLCFLLSERQRQKFAIFYVLVGKTGRKKSPMPYLYEIER